MYILGKPLLSMDAECSRFMSQMEELKLHEHVLACRIVWQLLLNLMSEVENELILDGTASNQGQGEGKA